MNLKHKNSLDLWIGFFWLVTGFCTFQLALFVISIPFESKEVWWIVIETVNKNATINFMISGFLLFAGIMQGVFGFFMIITRDSSVDKHVKIKKSKFEPKEDN
jgi:hypothetical protein